MNKLFKISILLFFCLVLTISPTYAKMYYYIIKDVPKSAIKEQIFLYAFEIGYLVSYASKDDTEFIVRAPYSPIIYNHAFETKFNINYTSDNS